MAKKLYTLLGPDGPYKSRWRGKLGGHSRCKVYGRLDCPSALKHIASGNYVRFRVFFANEGTAKKCGYRPCSVCMPREYEEWKRKQQ